MSSGQETQDGVRKRSLQMDAAEAAFPDAELSRLNEYKAVIQYRGQRITVSTARPEAAEVGIRCQKAKRTSEPATRAQLEVPYGWVRGVEDDCISTLVYGVFDDQQDVFEAVRTTADNLHELSVPSEISRGVGLEMERETS